MKMLDKFYKIYREKGRFKAIINPQKVILEEGGIGLVFSINEGPRTEIKSINFIGNKKFSDARLRSVIESSQKNIFSFISTNDDYSELRQEKDRKLLEEFYSDEKVLQMQKSRALLVHYQMIGKTLILHTLYSKGIRH